MKLSFTAYAIDSSVNRPAAMRSTVPASPFMYANSGFSPGRNAATSKPRVVSRSATSWKWPGSSRERDLAVARGRRRHPHRGELADVDLVRERDLQHRLRIAGRRLGERGLAGGDDRRELFGLERFEVADERGGVHARKVARSPHRAQPRCDVDGRAGAVGAGA